MSSAPKSRWAEDDAETEALIEQKKREKEEKKRAKAEKQRKQEEAQRALAQKRDEEAASSAVHVASGKQDEEAYGDARRPTKRRRLSAEPESQDGNNTTVQQQQASLLRFPAPEWRPCRHVDNFERLNHIEEGSYGWVSRAKENATGEIVALKKLKMENSQDGFPITGLREIQTLLESKHNHIIHLREIVMGDNMDE